jgi:triacylglycerol esterase/lipase EstA (alpha/beta hydrolase family)
MACLYYAFFNCVTSNYSDLLNGTVKNLAGGLQFWLTRQGINTKEKVLLAHSMGGLIGWSYLNEWGGNASTLRLITLGTPFHGTPAANNLWC